MKRKTNLHYDQIPSLLVDIAELADLKIIYFDEKRTSGKNCTKGKKSGWHNKHPRQPPFPLQNNVSMTKRMLMTLSSFAKNLLNLTFARQYSQFSGYQTQEKSSLKICGHL